MLALSSPLDCKPPVSGAGPILVSTESSAVPNTGPDVELGLRDYLWGD